MNLPTQPFSNKLISWRHGKQWFDQGIMDFKALKSYWYFACLLLGLLMMLVGQFAPKLLPIVMVFISPLFTAFMMNLCRAKHDGKALDIPDILSKLQYKINGFLLLGVISAVLSLLFEQIHLQIQLMLGLSGELTQEMVENMTGKEAFVRSILNLLTNLPVAMALAFSPALICFNNSKPIRAIIDSFLGVVRGWKGFVVMVLMFILMFMAVVVFASLILTMITALTGAVSGFVVNLIIFFFVLTAAGIGISAQYQAFCDIYHQDSPSEENDGTEIYTEI